MQKKEGSREEEKDHEDSWAGAVMSTDSATHDQKGNQRFLREALHFSK